MTLDEVTDIEQLRRAAKVLEAENLVMAKMTATLEQQLHEQTGGAR